MKNTIRTRQSYYTVVLAISFAIHFSVNAQAQLPCPEPKVTKEQLKRLLEYRNSTTSRTQAGNIQVRVFAHIVADDDGASPGATAAQIQKEINTMQNDFAGAGICFVYVGYNQVNSTLLNHINVDTHDDEETLFGPHVISNCMNIFYTREIRGTNQASGGGYGGITFNLPTTWCLVAKGSLGKHTSSHEIGHCFGLFHTFDHDRFGYERIDGFNCAIAGDIICDTKADPYAYRADPCFVTNNGFYVGDCQDPNGESNFDPPYNNIMSYWHHDPESFSSEQFSAMRSTIDNESDLRGTKSLDNYLFASGTYNFERTFKSAVNSMMTVGDIQLLQISQTGLFAKTIIVSPGFHAMPGLGGYALLKANECSGGSPQPIARQSQSQDQFAKSHDSKDGERFLVYPNPSAGKFVVEFETSSLTTKNATLILTNLFGQRLLSKNVKMVNGKLKDEVITNEKSGVYFITILIGDKTLKTQVVIAR